MDEMAPTPVIKNIKKRNGEIVPFDASKISNAIRKANLESTDATFSTRQLDALTRSVIRNAIGRSCFAY